MLKLVTLEIAAFVDLGDGAVIYFRKPTLIDMQGIRQSASRALASCDAPFDEPEESAIDEEGPRTLSAEGVMAFSAAVAFETCRRCLTHWDGIGDANGNPAPVTPDAIAALLAMPDVFGKVHAAIVAPLVTWIAEKNASALSRAGTLPPASAGAQKTAAGAPIATDVAESASPALTQ